MARQTDDLDRDLTPVGKPGISRRTLLRGAVAGSVALVLGGCGVATPSQRHADLAPFPQWHPLLPSPQPPGVNAAADPAATPTPGGVSLAAFLALSSLLTGIDNLNPQVGQVYLDSLTASGEFDITLAELYEQAGFTATSAPSGIEELEQRGLFEQEGARTLADKIIDYWYSGVYDTPDGEQAVATFADALVWRAVRYTKPLTLCAAPGFWALAPQY
jgi:hypothetical protein